VTARRTHPQRHSGHPCWSLNRTFRSRAISCEPAPRAVGSSHGDLPLICGSIAPRLEKVGIGQRGGEGWDMGETSTYSARGKIHSRTTPLSHAHVRADRPDIRAVQPDLKPAC
jgi:hypothetical protein